MKYGLHKTRNLDQSPDEDGYEFLMKLSAVSISPYVEGILRQAVRSRFNDQGSEKAPLIFPCQAGQSMLRHGSI